jgi:hypothetical protein
MPNRNSKEALMRNTCLVFVSLVLAPLVGSCLAPNLATICPHKPITQGVFGEITDANGALEQNVEVDAFGILNGVKDKQIASAQTSRGGYQFNLLPSTYILCAKTVCTMIEVPTGLVELSAMDLAAGLTWDAPVAVPPAQMIGPCKFGS